MTISGMLSQETLCPSLEEVLTGLVATPNGFITRRQTGDPSLLRVVTRGEALMVQDPLKLLLFVPVVPRGLHAKRFLVVRKHAVGLGRLLGQWVRVSQGDI